MLHPLEEVENFFGDYWEQRPLHLRGVFPEAVLARADLDTLLGDRVLTSATVSAAVDGRRIDPARVAVAPTPLAPNSMGPQSVIDADRLLGEFQRGASLAFDRIDEHVPSVAAFAARFEQVIGHPVRANAYLTPPDAPGFGSHIDATDVFVVQCEGMKRWEFWERQIPRPLCDETWKMIRPTGPPLVVELEAGDMLYLPRGWRHRVEAGPKPSLSISLTPRTVTRTHVARAAFEAAGTDETLRGALRPAAFADPETLEIEIAETIHDLVTALQAVDHGALAAAIRGLVFDVRRARASVTIDEAIDAMGLGRHHRIGLGDGVSIVGAELRRGQESATPPAPFVAALSEADELGVPLDELRGMLPFEVADPLARTLIERGWLRSV